MTALDPKFGEVETKITDASSLVKKRDYNARISVRRNILLLLVIINLKMTYMIQN